MDNENQRAGGDGSTTVNKIYRSFPVVPMDIYTFLQLQMNPIPNDSGESKGASYHWSLGDYGCSPHNQVHSAWIVAFVKQAKIRTTVNSIENEPTYNLDLEIRDGSGQLKIIQFKTTLGNGEPTDIKLPSKRADNGEEVERYQKGKASPFEENQYYSFVVKPLAPKIGHGLDQNLPLQGYLVSYSKIEHFNDVTLHLSEFVRACNYMLSPTIYTLHKIIRGYSVNGTGVSDEIIRKHLERDNVDEGSINNALNDYLPNHLLKHGYVIQNEHGYMYPPQQ